MNNEVNNNFNNNNQPMNQSNVVPQQNTYQQLMNQPNVVPQPQNNYQPPVENNTPVQNNTNKKNIKPFIIIGVIIVIIIIGLVVFLKKSDSSSTARNDEDYVNVFFINKDGKYALYNDNGKQLTDFIFDKAEDFVNGTAIVQKGDQRGIINTSGKTVVEFGKYDYIYERAGFYDVKTPYIDERYNRHEYIIDSSGKELFDLNDKYWFENWGSKFIIVKEKATDKYYVYSTNGKLMLTLDEVKNGSFSYDEGYGYLSLNYNKTNYILNVKTGKQISSFKSDSKFCFDEYNTDTNLDIITLKSCYSITDSDWREQANKTAEFRIIKSDKLYDLSNQCTSIMHYNKYGNNIICNTSDGSYLLDFNFKKGTAKNEWGVSFYDINHSVTNNLKNGWKTYSVDFYEGENVIKNVPCTVLYSENESAKQGLLVLKTYKASKCDVESGLYEYYNSKGEKAINKSFKSAESFDENGYAIVSDDKKAYYLINSKGEKISEDYDSISTSYNGKWYYVTKDGLKGLLNSKTKVLLKPEYKEIEVYSYDNYIARLKTNDNKYVIYDLDKKSNLLTFDKEPKMYDHYITYKDSGVTKYYTLSGKLFYTEK